MQCRDSRRSFGRGGGEWESGSALSAWSCARKRESSTVRTPRASEEGYRWMCRDKRSCITGRQSRGSREAAPRTCAISAFIFKRNVGMPLTTTISTMLARTSRLRDAHLPSSLTIGFGQQRARRPRWTTRSDGLLPTSLPLRNLQVASPGKTRFCSFCSTGSCWIRIAGRVWKAAYVLEAVYLLSPLPPSAKQPPRQSLR